MNKITFFTLFFTTLFIAPVMAGGPSATGPNDDPWIWCWAIPYGLLNKEVEDTPVGKVLSEHRYDEAISMLEKAIASLPHSNRSQKEQFQFTHYQVTLALSYRRNGDYDKAMAAAKAGLDVVKTLPLGEWETSDSFEAKNRFVPHAQKGRGFLHLEYGRALIAAGQRTKGRKQFKEAIRLGAPELNNINTEFCTAPDTWTAAVVAKVELALHSSKGKRKRALNKVLHSFKAKGWFDIYAYKSAANLLQDEHPSAAALVLKRGLEVGLDSKNKHVLERVSNPFLKQHLEELTNKPSKHKFCDH